MFLMKNTKIGDMVKKRAHEATEQYQDALDQEILDMKKKQAPFD